MSLKLAIVAIGGYENIPYIISVICILYMSFLFLYTSLVFTLGEIVEAHSATPAVNGSTAIGGYENIPYMILQVSYVYYTCLFYFYIRL